MVVKGVRSGHRLLDVMEGVASRQPVGVSELARALGEQKSTAQRMLQTLFHAGWIRPALGAVGKWEMTSRIHVVAHKVEGIGPLCHRARAVLAELCEATGETVVLALREQDGFVVAEVAESADEWRMVPRVGNAVPDRLSASALAVLPYLSAPLQAALIGAAPDPATVGTIRADGFAVCESERGGGSVNIAAPVFDAAALPIAAVVLTAPLIRLPVENRPQIGRAVAAVAGRLSLV